MSIFSNTSNTSLTQFNNYSYCDYEDLEKREELSSIDIGKLTYKVSIVDTIKLITINSIKNEIITYYIGTNPLTGTYLTSNVFSFSSSDNTEYYVAVKNNEGIIVIFDKIVVSNL